MTLAAAGLVYLALGFVLWVRAWAEGASTHTVCGCGDPALFLWFFQWPATALAHGHNPFYSTALFHPTGVNLLAQTSVMGLSVPLIPVTWIWGPVASINVAATVTPALSAFTAFAVVRRWASWTPAAFLGGLFFGFSPFVLNDLQFVHMMTVALMLLPLVLAVLDEILVRQRHGAVPAGALLGLLLFGQFFLSTELLVILVMIVVIGIVMLAAGALVLDRDGLVRRVPHAAKGLAAGVVVSVALLAWPTWYALEGPAHLSGLLWSDTQVVGGFIFSSFVAPNYAQGAAAVYLTFGGYAGPHLASSGYFGWGALAVFAGGVVAFWRDARLCFFGFILLLCAVFSLGARKGEFQPAHLFTHIPVIDNVIEQRFIAFGFLAAAVLLAMIVDKVHRLVPDWRGVVAALGVALVALVPIVVTFAPRLPFRMQAVTLPRWYAEVAPTLPPDRVLLSYPAPFSGIQVAMSWQAVNRMNYSQAGGGGPEGAESRAGAATPGFNVLSALGFGIRKPQPTGTGAELAAVRHALALWRVTTVVVATNPGASKLEQGHDPTYAAAFMTAALGRPPVVEAGAWVWNGVAVSLQRQEPLDVSAGLLPRCVQEAERRSGRIVASERVPTCVIREAAVTR